MADETQDVTPDSSLEGAIASSPEAVEEATQVVQETETETPETEAVTPEQEPEGKIPYDRFKEVNEAKKLAEQQAEWYKQQLESQLNRQPQQPTVDPDAGKTPEEKLFWQQVRAEAAKVVKPQIQAGVQEIASLRAQMFLNDHPDVKVGTPEYTQICQKVNSGYLPDDAYKSVFYDKKVATRQTVNQQTQQQRLEAKKKANVVSNHSVSNTVVPPGKESFEEEFARRLDKEWDGKME